MKNRVQRYYRHRAKTYKDLDFPDTIVSSVRAIGIVDHLRIMDLQGDESVLDVGCGQGRFLSVLAGKSLMALGVDFTQEMLEKAKGEGALLVRGDAENLPLKGGVFEKTHSAGLLGVYKSRKICEEMARVTKKGGKIYISFPATKSISGIVARFFMFLGWNPTLLDYWYNEKEIQDLMPGYIKILEFHRLGFEPPFQRLYKNIRSPSLVKIFVALEKRLRDRAVFKYFGGRYLVEAEK